MSFIVHRDFKIKVSEFACGQILKFNGFKYRLHKRRVKVRTSENILARCKIKGYHQKVEKRSAHCYSLYYIFFKIATFRSEDLRQANSCFNCDIAVHMIDLDYQQVQSIGTLFES